MEIWTADAETAKSVKLYPGEYLCIVAFVREYGPDCECLDASGRYEGPTPERLAALLNAEIQEACDEHGGPAGRWQVLAVDAPR